MTGAILAVMSLLLSGGHQEILSPKMDKALITMERVYEKQGVSPMTTGCNNVDSDVDKDRVILVWECQKNTEFYIVFDLVKMRWMRLWSVNNSILSFKTK